METSVPRPGLLTTLKRGLRAVEDFEALLHILHADAGAGRWRRAGARAVAHADAVVGYFDEDAVAVELAAQGDGAAVDARLEAVLDAVFDERLEQDAGDEDVEGSRIDFLFDVQLVGAEADHFDVEVVVGEAEFVAQGDVGVVILEQRAQDVGELHGHFAGEFGLDADQGRDGVEGVEEEVGIDLTLQGVEAGFEQEMLLLFELHFDAEGIPDLESDADDDGCAEPDQHLHPRLGRRPGQTVGGETCAQSNRGMPRRRR